MKILIEKIGKTKTVKYSGEVKGLLLKLKIESGSVLVVRNNELLTPDEKVSDKDTLKILSVISGG